MSEFNELIKNMEKIRAYMRQFFIYGFKVRSDYTDKSSRTYDNEKRRIESYLSRYISYTQTPKGKAVSLFIESNSILQNPFYAAWKAKSFTNNDIMLHFFLFDILNKKQKITAEELTNLILAHYEVIFDIQTVRNKLKKYEKIGLLSTIKTGKQVYYLKHPLTQYETGSLLPKLLTCISYFQEASPLGFIGNTMLDWFHSQNILFSFQHHFIVHTLDDEILFKLLSAINEQRYISFVNHSVRFDKTSVITGIPLKVFVSTQTGRRYICLYLEYTHRFSNFRLDYISSVTKLNKVKSYSALLDKLHQNLPYCWGVSFGGKTRLEEIHMTLFIEEEKESKDLERLYRERRNGEIIRIKKNTFLFSISCFDSNELLPWIKTFIGKITDIQGSNAIVINKLYADLDSLYAMYCEDDVP